MFDWDKIVIEVDNNIVDLTAGEVALLIAADADTVTWGNITGDLTQQADLMLELDSKIDVDSPEFTGTPRTPTPPAGNNSTRIANTEFVQNAVNGGINAIFPIDYQSQLTNKPNFGTLAFKNTVSYSSEVTNKPTLGALASKNSVNYETDISNKPNLGGLAYKNTANYIDDITNKPTLGRLASKNYVSYQTDVTDKPSLGTLASKNMVDYETEIINKPYIPVVPSLGTLATKDSVNYVTEVTNKPTFGSLASKNSVDYETEVYNKPAAGEVEQKDLARVVSGLNNTAVYAGQFVWSNSKLYMATRYHDGSDTAPSGTFVIQKLADEVTDKAKRKMIATTEQYSLNEGDYFIDKKSNELYRVLRIPTEGESWTDYTISTIVNIGDELVNIFGKLGLYFYKYDNNKVGRIVRYHNKLYRFIYHHNTGEWNDLDVVEINYAKEFGTDEQLIQAVPPSTELFPSEYEGLDKELRKAGSHAITKINVNYSDPGVENVETIVFSGHKRITVVARDGNAVMFNGNYEDGGKIQNLFYSLIVEDGAILELTGDIRVYHRNSNGILIRRGGMVIHHGTLNINLPSTNYHDGIYVESGGKFISDGTITATRGSTVYQDYPSHVIYVDYGGEAHVNSISANYYNYCIGCRGGIASYNSISGAGVTTSAGGRIFTGAQ